MFLKHKSDAVSGMKCWNCMFLQTTGEFKFVRVIRTIMTFQQYVSYHIDVTCI